MFRLLMLSPFLILFLLNPTLDDFKNDTQKRIHDEQSTARASWSSLSKVTGVNALSRFAGLGNYKMCRKNLGFFSLFTVRNSKIGDSSEYQTVALGVASTFFAAKNKLPEKSSDIFSSLIHKGSELVNFSDCQSIHKDGDLTAD